MIGQQCKVYLKLLLRHGRRPFAQYQCAHRLVAHFLYPNENAITNRTFGHRSISTNGLPLDIQNNHLVINVPEVQQPLSLDYMWLRDHCRCNECFNYKTNQRILDLVNIPSDIRPLECHIESDNTLVVLWLDGHHSKYPISWLSDHSYEGRLDKLRRLAPTLWDNSSVSSVARVGMDDYIKGERGLQDLIKSIVNLGVGIVENVPATIVATEKVVTRMAPVQNTFFGGMWEFSDEMAHNDTAYTRQALGAHNDNTYFDEAAGLQVFHCLHHEGNGGETLLVDGFRAASDLRASHSDAYDVLTSTPIESEYLEPGQHFSSTAPVLRLHPISNTLQQVRFNLYDRAPMSLPSDQVSGFYRALRLLAAQVRQPSGEWWVKLKPGMVIFIDNWRVLHGRAAYTGTRKMGGCYVNRSDFLSKARVLNHVC